MVRLSLRESTHCTLYPSSSSWPCSSSCAPYLSAAAPSESPPPTSGLEDSKVGASVQATLVFWGVIGPSRTQFPPPEMELDLLMESLPQGHEPL